LYDAQRRVRPATRPAIRARDAGLRFRSSARDWTVERREEWVLQRVREVVRAAARTPFYEDRFRAVGFDPESAFGYEEFARLPVLERSDVRAAGTAIRDPEADPALAVSDSTGGSAGEPTTVWKGAEERGWGESARVFYMGRLGIAPGDRRALLWGHHLDPVASDSWSDRFRALVNNDRWYDCFRMTPERLTAYHRDLQRWRPACVIAYASALAALARAVAGQGLEAARYPRICFVTGAEKLLSADRSVIEQVYQRPVHERYGSRDVGLIGFQVDPAATGEFEIDWANLLVEPETGPGVSGVLVTKLHADAMPMIRYRIGDVARFPAGARPGHPSWTIQEVIGRDTERIWLPDGTWFHPIGLPHLMKDLPVEEFRVEQAADFSITVQVVPARGYGPATTERVTDTLRSNVPGVPIIVECRDSLERTRSGKRRIIVSHATPQTESR
jgi:phenylacetate-CoA ligase